ncbi:MAG: VanZ family protein [Pirellulales bacterium]
MFHWLNRSRITLLSRLALAGFWITLFTATHVPVPTTVGPPEFGDKIAHFSAYLILAFLLATAWQLAGGILTTRHLVFAWLAVIGYGAFDEITQIPVGRDCELLDWVADAAGSATGLALFVALRHLIARRFALNEE